MNSQKKRLMKFKLYHFLTISFFPVYADNKEIPLTAITLNLIPGISPTA